MQPKFSVVQDAYNTEKLSMTNTQNVTELQPRMTREQLIDAARTAAKFLPVASAQLMNELATRLDYTSVALCEAMAQRKELALEINAIKSGPAGFFAYGSECGYEEFETAEEAKNFAEDEISDFRDHACDGWSEEVTSVVWGIVIQRATMTGLRDVTEDDGCDPAIEQWCDYELLPVIDIELDGVALHLQEGAN